METKDFHFDLPENLIAQNPTEQRGESRLMIVNRCDGSFKHDSVVNLAKYLPTNSLMVFNNSRVRNSRLTAVSENGAHVEFLLVKKITDSKWEIICSKMKKRTLGSIYKFEDGISGEITEILPETRIIDFSHQLSDDWLNTNAHLPLPPYIRRNDTFEDANRYQTIYAQPVGSSAAPTAGLHFTDSIFDSLDAKSIKKVFITLHVGLGTFLPVRSKFIIDHKMHSEEYFIGNEESNQINECKAGGKKLIAVGTTSLRTLESAAEPETGFISPGNGKTDIFIYPGYKFKTVDILFTNFHTPESTLLMLVSAFAGKDLIFKAYREAIELNYRFFSYGDAMLIL